MQTTKDEVEEILEKLLKNLSSEELEVLVQQKKQPVQLHRLFFL